MTLPFTFRLLVCASLIVTAPAWAQKEAYRRDLQALCGEVMAGRATGTPGDQAAIAYLLEAMEGIGLRAACGTSFRQEFGVEDPGPATVGANTACALLPGGGTGSERQLTLAIGTEVVPFRFSTDGEVTAGVVFAGHGLVVPDLGIDDYRGLEVEGRVVVVLRGGPRWRESGSPLREHRGELSFRIKMQRAAERGAAAVLLVDRDDGRPEAEPRVALNANGTSALPALWVRRSAVAQLFSGGVEGLRAVQTALDAGKSPAELGLRLLPRAAVRLRVEMGARRPELRTANVIGVLPGNCAEGRREVIVVGAHFDHLGRGEYASLAARDEVGRVHPGADDNASGVAGMLELARRFRAGKAPRRTLVFVAFGAEELGQVGSKRFLEDGPMAKDAIAAMIDLDMIGRASSGSPSLYGVDSGTGLRQLLQGHLGKSPLRVQVKAWTSYRSDQAVFLGQGVPALLFTTGLHEDYHRPSDTPDQVEIDGALQVIDLAEAVLRSLADAPQRSAFSPRAR